MQAIQIKTLLLLLLLSLATSLEHQYMSIPFKRQYNSLGHNKAYLVPTSNNNSLINIQLILQNKKNIAESRPTTQKQQHNDHQDSMLILQFKGHRIIDERISAKWRFLYNNYYYLKNIFSKTTWINLHNNQNAFNFSPQNITQLQTLKHLYLFNPFMRKHIIGLNLNDKNGGDLIIGDFPVDKLLKHDKYFKTNIKGKSKWFVEVKQLALEYHGANMFKQSYIQTSKMAININSKTIVSEQMAGAITNNFKTCIFQNINEMDLQNKLNIKPTSAVNSINRYLICNSKEQYLSLTNSAKIILKFPDNEIPIIIKLQTLSHRIHQNRYLIDLDYGEELQLGQNVLKSYILGIDYEQMKLIYGQKDNSFQINIKKITTITFWVNFVVFIVSLFIIIVKQAQPKIQNSKSRSNQRIENIPKSNQYQLAEMNEQQIEE